MTGFILKILTPDEIVIDQEVKKIIVRTTEGDVGILKNHVNYIAAIKNGPIKIFFLDDSILEATLKDGFISVINNKAVIMILSYNKILN
ncbi:MAG: F0F1 ATP synthase subunit epsilon [Oscillospiraceae bacterium]|nr:F0F1 ATP synthase subunit epsilon [Oscillospiraceae bacterium]